MLTRKPIYWLSLAAIVVFAAHLAFTPVARAQIVMLSGTDRFAEATTVTEAPVTVQGINTQATKEPGEPNHAGNTGGRSIWWRFQAPVDGTYTIDTQGSNFDTTLGIYRGSSVSQLSTTTSNNNVAPPITRYSSVDISGNAGDLFHIAVDGWNGDSGSVTLNISAPRPVNDEFEYRIVTTQSPKTLNGSNVNATKQSGEPNHGGNTGGKSVWWKLIVPASGTYTINTEGSNFDTTLGIYTGNSVDNLTLRAGNDDVQLGVITHSQVTFFANVAEPLNIAVDGLNGDSGSIALNISGPVNAGVSTDRFAEATTVTEAPFTVHGINTQATKESGEPNHGGNTGGKSMWWKLFVPASGTYTINTEGSNFDTTLGIYTGNSVDNLTLRAGNDDVQLGVITHSQVTFFANVAEHLNIAVDGLNGDSGSITLNISGPVNAGVSKAPLSFNLLYPEPDFPFFTTLPPILFDWEDSIDPDRDPVTYNLILRTCRNVPCFPREIAFSKTGITVSSFVLPPLEFDRTLGIYLPFGKENSWSVEAVDADGEVTSSNTRTFRFRFSRFNDSQRLITGLVISDLNQAAIVAATISTKLSEAGSEIYVQKSETDGRPNTLIYFSYDDPKATPKDEKIQLEISAPGFETLTLERRGGLEETIPVEASLVEVDSDGDGLSDNQENNIQTNPKIADSDGDGLSDGDEVNLYRTDPLLVDTDGDGIPDGGEIAAGSNPNFNPAAIIPSITILLNDD